MMMFHVMQLPDRRSQGEITEQQETAQRAACQAAFKGQLSRRTTQGVSRPCIDVAS
ncbi:TPA: hypothetical protein ACP4MJ_004227 [Escherichia coli]|nr:hypothetical protein [Escherichia coli]